LWAWPSRLSFILCAMQSINSDSDNIKKLINGENVLSVCRGWRFVWTILHNGTIQTTRNCLKSGPFAGRHC
jgi:hypothetical protein